MTEAIRLRPGKRTFIIFTIIFLIPVTLAISIAIFNDPTAWKGVLFFLVMAICYYSWIYFHVIDIHPNRISYFSLFGGRRSLFINEIKKWSIRVGIFKYMDRFKPTVRLEIESSDPEKKPIIIAIKLFKKEDVDKVLSVLPANKEAKKNRRERS